MATIQPPPGVSAGGSGWIRLQDADGQGAGVVSNKGYSDNPTDTELDTFDSSTFDLTLTIRSAFANILVNATPFTLTVAADSGHYEGTINFSVLASGPVTLTTITPDGATGATDIFNVTVDTAPELVTLSFTGGYPGIQTELKTGDSFQITGTTDKPCTGVEIQNLEACIFSDISFASSTSFTVTGTIADRGTTPVSREAFVRAKNAAGALGTQRGTNAGAGGVDGTDVVVLNDLYPVIDGVGKGGATSHAFGISYPGIQGALKDVEQASVIALVSNFDTILYDDPTTSEIDVAAVTANNVFTNPKVVARSGGTYNITTDNFRIVSSRAANASATTVSGVVAIADTVAVLTVTHPGARVRSGAGVGNDTVVTMSFDQQMDPTPSMAPAASRGTFQGGAFVDSGNAMDWTRTLRVLDSENPADGSSNTWLTPSGTNLAGRVTNAVTTNPSYVVGGFTPRTINYPAFTADSTESIPVTTESNLSIGSFSNGNTGVVQPFGTADTTAIGREGWWAPNAATGLTTGHMLHTPTVSANSGGLTLVSVEETS